MPYLKSTPSNLSKISFFTKTMNLDRNFTFSESPETPFLDRSSPGPTLLYVVLPLQAQIGRFLNEMLVKNIYKMSQILSLLKSYLSITGFEIPSAVGNLYLETLGVTFGMPKLTICISKKYTSFFFKKHFFQSRLKVSLYSCHMSLECFLYFS